MVLVVILWLQTLPLLMDWSLYGDELLSLPHNCAQVQVRRRGVTKSRESVNRSSMEVQTQPTHVKSP